MLFFKLEYKAKFQKKVNERSNEQPVLEREKGRGVMTLC